MIKPLATSLHHIQLIFSSISLFVPCEKPFSNAEMWHLLLLLTIIATVVTSQVRAETLDCTGHHRYHATGTGYYPSNDPMEGGFYDMHGHRLHTLQVRTFT